MIKCGANRYQWSTFWMFWLTRIRDNQHIRISFQSLIRSNLHFISILLKLIHLFDYRLISSVLDMKSIWCRRYYNYTYINMKMTCIWLIILILIEYKRFHRTKFIMNLLDVPKTRDRRYRLQLILSNLLFIWRHKCHHFNIKEKKSWCYLNLYLLSAKWER